MSLTRRQFLAASGTAGALTIAGCLGGSSSSGKPSGPVATAPIPKSPSKYTYAMMGTGEPPVVTYFGNWKCPACKQFDTGMLKDIVTDYVEPEKIRLQFRALAYIPGTGEPFLGPDAPRAGAGRSHRLAHRAEIVLALPRVRFCESTPRVTGVGDNR